MKRTYRGSCHCGAVRFECDADFSAEGTSKCNCSICAKSRFWKVVVPGSDFRVLEGAGKLSQYSFGGDTGAGIRHHFCSVCGIKTFGMGEHAALGGIFYGVNIACLDDLSDAERAALPVTFQDGRNNKWEAAPAETRYL